MVILITRQVSNFEMLFHIYNKFHSNDSERRIDENRFWLLYFLFISDSPPSLFFKKNNEFKKNSAASIPSFLHLSRTMSFLKGNMIFRTSFATMELNHLISLFMNLASKKEVVKLSYLMTGFLRKRQFAHTGSFAVFSCSTLWRKAQT